MTSMEPLYLSVEQAVDHIIQTFGNDIRIAMPLGLGKPVPLINALYNRAKQDHGITLSIYTALSLEKPTWTNPLEQRFLEPFVQRVWGSVPDLQYMLDMRKGELPSNVRIHELFFKAGAYHGVPQMQQDFISSNYTHSVRDCNINGTRIFAHMVAKDDKNGTRCLSTSCNADTSLQTLKEYAEHKRKGEKRLAIGMVNSYLPFMYGDAEVSPEQYDIIIEGPECNYPLFSTPRLPVSDPDYMIGMHVSSLIRDDGTLQIGIGALGDAISYGLDMRQKQNEVYRELVSASGISAEYQPLIDEIGGTEPFVEGIYGSTEMLVDAFIQLYKSGVVKRKVYHHVALQSLINQGKLSDKDDIPGNILDLIVEDGAINPYLLRKDFEILQRYGVFRDDLSYEQGHIVDGYTRHSANLDDESSRRSLSRHCLGTRLRNGILASGGFFLGPRDFYETLRNMSDEERRQFEMVGVEVANQLYGDEVMRRLERKHGRFCNTGMKATLLGHIVSDGTDDGTMVSGVGGQYNFVSMAHALDDGRLIMMIKSTRQEHGKAVSNIVYNYSHVTIPRHLRDIVVTEYGIADIRGKSDQDVIKAMLNVADSRFQQDLLEQAKKHRKLPADYEIPERFRHNTPQRLAGLLQGFKAQGYFSPFPYGSEFNRVEMILAQAMKTLKVKSAKGNEAEMAAAMKGLPLSPPEKAQPFLERMGLAAPDNRAETEMQKTVLLAMALAGII